MDSPASVSSNFYGPLPNNTIRLVRIAPGDVEEELYCQLITCEIASPPVFEALSYVWGDNAHMKAISMDGEQFLVRPSLYHCLHHIRQLDTPTIVWADALCINQEDNDEKSVQIRLMPRIYQSAASTLIWLGLDLGRYYPEHRKPPEATLWPYSDGLKMLEQLAQGDHLDYSSDNVRRSWLLRQISQLEWWSRVWVVQETLLSASAYLVLGNHRLPWKVAFQAMKNFTSHEAYCCRRVAAPPSTKNNANLIHDALPIVSQVVLSFQRIPPGTGNELPANIWMFRNRMSTLERDKIYGVLGLIRSPNFTFSVDYSSRYIDVCRGVILDDIKASGNLNVLKGVRGAEIWKGASWITDWSNWDWWAEDQARILMECYGSVFKASGTHVPRIETFPDRRLLGVAGQVIDEVAYTSNYSFDSNLASLSTAFRTMRTYWMNQLSQDSKGAVKGSFFNAFWRTLLTDTITPYQSSTDMFFTYSPASDTDVFKPPSRRANAGDFFVFILWWLWKHPTLSKSLPKCGFHTMLKIPAFATINTSIIRATSGRRLFLTSGGSLGLGPERLRDTTKVTILLGATTPIMLWAKVMDDDEDEQQYKLLGDCYVHGCMDGELVKDAQVEDWPTLKLV